MCVYLYMCVCFCMCVCMCVCVCLCVCVDMGGNGALPLCWFPRRRNFVHPHTVAARQPGTTFQKFWTFFSSHIFSALERENLLIQPSVKSKTRIGNVFEKENSQCPRRSQESKGGNPCYQLLFFFNRKIVFLNNRKSKFKSAQEF